MAADADAVVCLVTAPPDAAPAIAEALVTKRLAACVNVVPQVHSVYRWEGEVTHDDESLLIVKTAPAAVPSIEDELHRIHPYDTFELIALDVTAGTARYLRWIGESVDAK
jgi:periplasmic divalent cation tolerance protein